MADSKISDLPTLTTMSDDDLLVVVDSPGGAAVTKKITKANVFTTIDTHMADGTKHFTEGSIDHTAITNVGNNTHTQIDTHITNVSNPHSVDKTDVGLSNVTNDAQLPLAGGTLTGNLTINSTATSGNSLSITRNLGAANTDSPVVNIVQDEATDDQYVLLIQNDGLGQAVRIEQNNTSCAYTFAVRAPGGSNEYFYVYGQNQSSGLAKFSRNLTSAATAGPVLTIEQDNAGDDQYALKIQQDGTGTGIQLDQTNAVGYGMNIMSACANQYAGLRVLNSATSGHCIYLEKNVNAGTRAPMVIMQNHLTGTTPCLELDQDDISEGFINFVGSNRGVITGATNSTKSVRVEINGVVGRLAFYADA